MSKQECLPKEEVLKLLEPGGLLTTRLNAFEVRPQQRQMLEDVVAAYNEGQIALIEAGTGTGKSMAYLIPALLWAARKGERTVISTNTIALQEQLLLKDIPMLIKLLGVQVKAALVKGMQNYICLRKLRDAFELKQMLPLKDQEQLEQIDHACRSNQEGSRSSLPMYPSSEVWELVNADSLSCNRNECPFYESCYFFKARREIQDAGILVVNHHLLFSDLLNREEDEDGKETGILPSYRRVVLDEAHHIEDIATEHLALRLNRMELNRTLNRLLSDKAASQPGKLLLLKQRLVGIFGNAPPQSIRQLFVKLEVDIPGMRNQIQHQSDQVFDTFEKFIEVVHPLLEDEKTVPDKKLRLQQKHQTHSYWVEAVVPRTQELITILEQFHQSLNNLESDLAQLKHDKVPEQTRNLRMEIQALNQEFFEFIDLFRHFLSEMKAVDKVRWIEAAPLKVLTNVLLVDAELDISKMLAKYLFRRFPTIVLCSATLSTNQQFSFVRQRLGIMNELLGPRLIKESIYDSPFEYAKQALLGVPVDLPLPSEEEFKEKALECIWKLIQTSKGGTFILFTSYSMLKEFYETLNQRLLDHRYIPFKQGDSSRRQLLADFKQAGRGVLFGTDSFWEGVDVPGDALRSVIIVKLPFQVPSEPIVQARTEAIVERGGNPFIEYSVPNAIVKFKQGFGRLIRNKWDRGCVTCLDTRLVNKRYGQMFIDSLPNCSVCFAPQDILYKRMSDFYKQTYYLTKQQKTP